MIVHNAVNALSAGQITAAVLFGDPFKMFDVGKLSTSNVKEFRALGDPVCDNDFNVLAHVSYGADAKTVAQFLVQAAGISNSRSAFMLQSSFPLQRISPGRWEQKKSFSTHLFCIWLLLCLADGKSSFEYPSSSA